MPLLDLFYLTSICNRVIMTDLFPFPFSFYKRQVYRKAFCVCHGLMKSATMWNSFRQRRMVPFQYPIHQVQVTVWNFGFKNRVKAQI